MKMLRIASLLVSSCALAWSGTAYACHLNGRVTCPDGRLLPNVGIIANATEPQQTWVNSDVFDPVAWAYVPIYTNTVVTDANGAYFFYLANPPVTVTVSVDLGTLPAGSSVVSASAPTTFTTNDKFPSYEINWVVTGPMCEPEARCWFTGGGAKIDPLLSIPVAERSPKGGPLHSFGGNVYPGCSPTAGDGGNWNHVARGDIKLHFQGRSIQVVKCGNVVPPPPPGSTSPETPYNFIEFQGTGTLKGIGGNKADYGAVQFYARAEDRNEPGSRGAKDGALIDRYYLYVYDASGELLLVNDGPLPEPMDPLPITDGNFQLHIRSCDSPPAW